MVEAVTGTAARYATLLTVPRNVEVIRIVEQYGFKFHPVGE
jgi:hypothetical protein